MYSFRTTLRVCGEDIAYGDPIDIDGQRYQPLAPAPQHAGQPFPLSFEDVNAAMTALERMFTEPDGSFVWTGDDPNPWQVEGSLVDLGGRLLYVELWGRCPPAAFDRLLQCLDWPNVRLMFYCHREGVFLNESEFRRFAAVRKTLD
jgi:hypothetical protein